MIQLQKCMYFVLMMIYFIGAPDVHARDAGRGSPSKVGASSQNTCGALPTVAQMTAAFKKLPVFQAEFAEFHNGILAATGTLYVSRPGKMRLEYDAPMTSIFVADGHWFIHFDRELGQPSHFPLKDNPAGFLLEDDVRLGDYVTEIRCDPRDPTRVLVGLNDAQGQGMKDLKLVIDRDTLRCREWMGWSQEGEHVHVILQNLVPLKELDKKLFQILR